MTVSKVVPAVPMASTRLVKLDPTRPDPDVIGAAAATLRSGGLVAFPTETVYGLGANALDAAAVACIYKAKGRPARNPIIVHVANAPAARQLAAEWPETAQRLADAFWPGPLTLVLPRTSAVPDIVTGGGATVGLRVPDQPIARALLEAAGVPIAAPSANRSNRLSPTTAEHVLEDLEGRVEWILDGGPTRAGIESTVLDLSSDPPRLLRPGPIPASVLAAQVGRLDTLAALPVGSGAPLPAPGMLRRHYAPRARLHLAADSGAADVQRLASAGLRVGWMLFEPTTSVSAHAVVVMPAEPAGYAARLYAALHELDATGVEAIVAAATPADPEWAAIRDRLERGAAE
jgi:L-threonylcarbamoyladenylate synthase